MPAKKRRAPLSPRALGIAKTYAPGDRIHVDTSTPDDDVIGTHRRAGPSPLQTLWRALGPSGAIELTRRGDTAFAVPSADRSERAHAWNEDLHPRLH